ncbi:TIGR02680 family protein [Caldanaerobius polysaccharolyticus]|uniref:TIGR02680 family protein n=1 Tax=Caldanaerobius polysaccharolyticus TaxID=44256 RepID=UPI000478B00E|nr:TIGR02680 family protein [Caldanaerobius polysaccharolyticus]
MSDRWIVNRIGLINFWYYDDEVFEFAGGRLLLRGSNGSGKSVTMQSFIPLILDANKSPERLDPFGSRARKLEDYLLGEEDINGIDERTGYLYMELKREYSDNYITFGIGLKAHRHQSMDFWGFIVLDGRRIGKDLFLYKLEVGEEGNRVKVPLTKKELKNAIGDGGKVLESQREYMETINKYVFGFETIDDYDELIKLLIQIRSPKLSKDFRPTVIYDILKASLPSLSDDDLRPLSETIENMDQIKMRLDELHKDMAAMKKLKDEYDNYNKFILYDKAKELLKAHNELLLAQKDYDKLSKDIDEYKARIDDIGEKILSMEREMSALKEKERQLRNNDVFKTQQELIEEQNRYDQYNREKSSKEENLKQKQSKYMDVKKKIDRTRDEMYCADKEVQDILDLMSFMAEEIDFLEHRISQDELKKNYGREFDFNFWRSQFKKHKEKIKKALDALKEEQDASKKYDESLREEERLRKQKDEREREVERCERLFDEEKSKFVEKVYGWSQENSELKLSRDQLEDIGRQVLAYGEKAGFDGVMVCVRRAYDECRSALHREKLVLENFRNLKQEELNTLEQELKSWKDKQDPEPERDPQVQNNRKRLTDAKIPFVPLYRCIEFKEDVDEETRGNIEAAMEDMGLLDALIIPSRYMADAMKMDKEMADRYIVPGAFSMQLNVFQYFDVVDPGEGVSTEDISDALSNILVYQSENSTYINQDGSYGIGIIRGKSRGNVRSKYIGYGARKRFREEMINSLKQKIEIVNAEIKSYNESIKSIDYRIERLDQEYSRFPAKDDLDVAYDYLKTALAELKFIEQKLNQQSIEVKKLFEDLQQKRTVVRETTSGIEIHRDVESFELAYNRSEEYDAELVKLEINYNRYLSYAASLEVLEQQKGELEYDIDNLKYEIDVLSTRSRSSEKKMQALMEAIDKLGLKEIEQELNSCLRRLEEIPEEIKSLSINIAKLEERSESNRRELQRLSEDITVKQMVYQIVEKGFKDELNLGFVYQEDSDDVLKLGKKIVLEYKALFDKPGIDKEKMTSRLQNAFYESLNELVDYGLSMGYIFDEEKHDGSGSEIYDVIKQKLRRYQITASLSGKTVSLYVLYQSIQDDINVNENLLKETDRHLFEEIIMHNVGRKIRGKIFKAEEWVKKMNKLMSERDTSSGLRFYLEWRPIAADNEQEMDTRELVDVLKSDVDMLKPDVFNKVVNHFRSKVEAARRIQEGGSAETFHKIIKEVLDYRDWFEFVLYYRKEGESRKVLTNNAFDRLSGGEKAMAMYIPLFSAVYSRYESASKNALKIISLDEAFAGVDDNNIRDMFKLIEDLGFNFIINSQVLWGDYDTVPELSICELVRPKNANYVTVIRYRWDGNVRHLITDAEGEAAIGWVGA